MKNLWTLVFLFMYIRAGAKSVQFYHSEYKFSQKWIIEIV